MSSITQKTIGGVLLVSGTTIGAGMLALPVGTGLAGFWPSILLLVGFWALMVFTAFLMLEVTLWLDPNTNLVSMAEQTLGTFGKIVSWVVYLFLLYALTTAYIAGSGPILHDAILKITGLNLPVAIASIPILLLLGIFVYEGTSFVDLLNRGFMVCLAASFAILVGILVQDVNAVYYSHTEWEMLPLSIALVATSFGFHIIIPSLTNYLNRDVRHLKQVILIGSFLPLLVYVIWVAAVLGTLDANTLKQGFSLGIDSTQLLSELSSSPWMSIALRSFTLFAILTSFLGVSLSLFDFLADGLNIQKNRKGRIILYFLTFLPPVIFTLVHPRAFFAALEYAGAYGVMILLGILPVLMTWVGRYHKQYASIFRTPGGRPALIVGMGLSLLVIAVELFIDK